jgi:hypothetical protein
MGQPDTTGYNGKRYQEYKDANGDLLRNNDNISDCHSE